MGLHVDAQALQKLLLAARQCLKGSQPERAIELLDAALKLDNTNVLALFLAGSARAALSEHAAAAAAFRRAAALTADAAPGSTRHQLHLTSTENLLLEAERVLPPSWIAALHDVPRLAVLHAAIAAAIGQHPPGLLTSDEQASQHPSAAHPAQCRVLVVGGLGLEAVLAAKAGAAAVALLCAGNPLSAELAAELAADSGCPPGAIKIATSVEQLDGRGQGPFDVLVLADALGSSIDWGQLRCQVALASPLLRAGAALLPHAVHVRGRLVECPAAVRLNEVDVPLLQADTGGLDLSAANRLLPRLTRSMHLPTRPHTALSPAATLLALPLASLLPTTAASPECAGPDGSCPGVSSSGPLAASTSALLPISASGTADALAWWVEQQLVPAGCNDKQLVLSAGPAGCSPQGALLQPHIWQHLQYLDRRQLAAGQAVEVRCSLAAPTSNTTTSSSGGSAAAAAATAAAVGSKAAQGPSLASSNGNVSKVGGGNTGASDAATGFHLEFEAVLVGSGSQEEGSLLLPVSEERMAVSAAVPRYHVSMLNDTARTAAYQSGIAATMQQAQRLRDTAVVLAGSGNGSSSSSIGGAVTGSSTGSTAAEQPLVLEIGSGSGLLCLLACQAGAHRVVGCERLPELQVTAAQLLAANGVADRVTILGKHSKELTVGAAPAGGGSTNDFAEDLPRRADVLLHEIFGTDPFSEGVVPSLLHARQHLLAPGALLAPCKLRVIAAVATSRTQHRLLRPPASVCGGAVTLRALCQLAPRKVDCQAGKAGELLLLTEPAAVLEVDFACPDLELAGSATALLECLPQPRPLAAWAAAQAAGQGSSSCGTAVSEQSAGDGSAGGCQVAEAEAETEAATPQLPGLLAGASLYAVSWFEYEFPGGECGSTSPHVQCSEHWQQVVQPLEGGAAAAVLEGLAGGSNNVGEGSSIGALLLTAGYRVDRLWFELAGVAAVASGIEDEDEEEEEVKEGGTEMGREEQGAW